MTYYVLSRPLASEAVNVGLRTTILAVKPTPWRCVFAGDQRAALNFFSALTDTVSSETQLVAGGALPLETAARYEKEAQRARAER